MNETIQLREKESAQARLKMLSIKCLEIIYLIHMY